MKKPYEISLRLYKSMAMSENVEYVQGDTDVYPLTIRLLDKNGGPYALPENATAAVNFEAIDRRSVIIPLRGYAEITDYEHGILIYKFAGEELYYPGRVTASVEVEHGSERLTWPNFAFEVVKSLSSPDAEPPEYMQPWAGQVDERLTALEQGGGGGSGGSGGSIAIDNHTLKFVNNKLTVNTTNEALADNTQPITSAGVYVQIGNINALLETI